MPGLLAAMLGCSQLKYVGLPTKAWGNSGYGICTSMHLDFLQKCCTVPKKQIFFFTKVL